MRISQLFLGNDDLDYNELERNGLWEKQGAGCIFLSQKTLRFGLAHRSRMVVEPCTWSTWGGTMGPGELPADAVRREVIEETGYGGNLDLVPLYVYIKNEFKYHNFLAIIEDEFVPKLNWETQSYGWFEWGSWPTPLHPGVIALLENSSDIMVRFIS